VHARKNEEAIEEGEPPLHTERNDEKNEEGDTRAKTKKKKYQVNKPKSRMIVEP
jgi:hypothetical protein